MENGFHMYDPYLLVLIVMNQMIQLKMPQAMSGVNYLIFLLFIQVTIINSKSELQSTNLHEIIG